jgi:hypothetical protein
MDSEPSFVIPDLEYDEEEQTNEGGEVTFEETVGSRSGTARSLKLRGISSPFPKGILKGSRQ